VGSAVVPPDNRRLPLPSRAVLAALAAVTLAGCSDNGNGGTNVDVPPLQITTATSGSDLDSDGYAASIDAGTPMAIGTNDTVIVGDAGAGNHVVTLTGVASNCRIQGSGSDTVTVADGSTADAAFAVVCGPVSAGDGQVMVTTATTGSNIDPDGYAILLDGNRVGSIRSNGTATVGGVPAGPHTVGLDSVAAGCQVSGDNPQTVAVAADSMSAAAFAVTCSTTQTGSIAKWTITAQPNNALLFDTWGSGPTDFFAAGTDANDAKAGVIEHYDGAKWTEQKRFPEIQLDAVWGTGPSDVYAAGGHNDTHAGALLHYDGSAWSEITGPSVTPASGDTLLLWQSVWGLSGQDIYLAGAAYGTGFTPLVAHFDGQQWSLFTLPSVTAREPLDVWATSPQNLYVVGVLHGAPDPNNANDQGLILHYNGSAWDETIRPAMGVHLKAVWGTASDNIYVVGDPGVIAHWDGTAWTDEASLITTALHEIWGTSSDNIYAVAARGHILRFDGTRWAEMDSPTGHDLFGIWGSAPDDAWVVGNTGVILHGTP
jgi:hypothetical protein